MTLTKEIVDMELKYIKHSNHPFEIRDALYEQLLRLNGYYDRQDKNRSD